MTIPVPFLTTSKAISRNAKCFGRHLQCLSEATKMMETNKPLPIISKALQTTYGKSESHSYVGGGSPEIHATNFWSYPQHFCWTPLKNIQEKEIAIPARCRRHLATRNGPRARGQYPESVSIPPKPLSILTSCQPCVSSGDHMTH